MPSIARLFLAAATVALWTACLPVQANDNIVQAYIETSNPLVDESGEPLGARILKEIENISTIKFAVTRSTYTRALHDLKAQRADMVLHVPHIEPGFEEYGIYLDWSISARADLYAMSPDRFTDLSAIGDKRIATPRGNTEFASHITGIPASKFIEANNFSSLVKMLAAGRVDLIWYERVSIRTQLRKQGIDNVYYYEIPVMGDAGRLSIGVQKTPRGQRLKQRLDFLMQKIDMSPLLEPYFRHLQPHIPQTGKVVHISPPAQ